MSVGIYFVSEGKIIGPLNITDGQVVTERNLPELYFVTQNGLVLLAYFISIWPLRVPVLQKYRQLDD